MNEKQLQNTMDNYIRTIRGMIGFMNFYRFDDATKKMKDDVLLMQGWRYKVDGTGAELTPDFSVLKEDKSGIVGEVKITFPLNEALWLDDFKQVKKYDQPMVGWPSGDEKVTGHDVVFLVDWAFSRKLKDYYEQNKNLIGEFRTPFAIIEFLEQDKADRFINYRTEYGSVSDGPLNARLKDGILVPANVFVKEYSMVKLYDSKPEPPYLMFLIWEHVIFDKASNNERFRVLKRRQRLPVQLKVQEIMDALDKGFTMKSLWPNGKAHKMPKLPEKDWVLEACNNFVEMGWGQWLSRNDLIEIEFQKFENDVLELITKEYLNLLDKKEEKEKQAQLPFNN